MKRFDWFIERIQTCVAFGWLSERSAEKTSCPKNFLEINRYFAVTSYCNTIGQSNNAWVFFGVLFGGKTKSLCFDLFIHWLMKQITNTDRNYFSRSYENRSITAVCFLFLLEHINKLKSLRHCYSRENNSHRPLANIYLNIYFCCWLFLLPGL